MRKLAVVICFLFVALGIAAQPMTVQVVAKGKILSMANPEKREKSLDVDIITKSAGNPRCVTSGAQELSLDAGCVLDLTRTYTTSTTPQCPSSYGQGGPGYGIVVNSCLAHGASASHSMSNGTLTSNIEVCRKSGTTQRGWYKAKHFLYMNCPVLVDWTQTYQFNTTATGTAWQYVGTLSPAPPSGVQNLTYTLSVTPSNLIVQSGLFSGDPNLSGDKGLNVWIKPGNNNDLTVTGLEVSQGVQNLQNTMPVIAGRRTIIRAYIRASLNNVNAVRASLTAYRNNVALGPPIEAENTPAIRTNGGTRATLDDAFWFLVPPAWRNQNGLVKFVVTADSTNTVPELDETNNSREVTVSFTVVPPMIITGVPLHMHVDADKNKPVLTTLPTDQNFWRITANLARMHPVSMLLLQDCGTPIQYPHFHNQGREWDMTDGGAQALVLYRVMQTRALSGCGSPLTHWIGLVHPNVSTDVLGIGMLPGKSSWVQMTPGGNGLSPWRVTGGETMAHELGHNAGLPHVRCDGSEGFPVADLYPHPEPNCRLAVGDDGYYGLDVYYQDWGHYEPAVISNDPNAPWGKRAFPIMGYKDPGWADPFDYCLLLLGNGVACNPLQMARMASAPVAGRDAIDAPPPRVRNGFLTVGGVLDTKANAFLVLEVAHTDSVGPNALAPSSSGVSTSVTANAMERRAPLVLAQVDAAGKELSATPIETRAADGDPSFVPFLRTLPREPQAAGIELRIGGTVLTRRMASANKPVVQLLEPNGGALSAATRIRWSGTDADGDALTYTLSYSPDAGRTWRPIATDLQQPVMSMPAGTRVPGSAAGVLRIEANDGFNTGYDDSDNPLTVPTSPPVPVILQPGVIGIPQGRTLLLQGTATDIDEGAITTPGQFLWSSDRDGQLGQGRELYVRTLSRGVHVITLEVRDAEGKIGKTSIRVYVGVPMPANASANVS